MKTFEIDQIVANIIGLPINNNDIKEAGLPCLTISNNTFTLWNSPFCERFGGIPDRKIWSPSTCSKDAEEWILKIADEHEFIVARLSLPDNKHSASFTTETTAVYSNGNTPSEALCLAFIKAFGSPNQKLIIQDIKQSNDSLSIEEESLIAYYAGNSMPIRQRILELQIKLLNKKLEELCGDVIVLLAEAIEKLKLK
jgi:hypothetical protein